MTLEQKAQKVRAQIKHRGMFLKSVAEKAEIDPMTLQRYFTLGSMSLDKLQRVCDAIGLELIIREKNEL
jgi:lambda repressor-like predicted transcriptional regulator